MFAAVQSYWGLNYVFYGIAGVQWFFAVISVFASIYAFVFLPETHGKKLSEITGYFNHHTIYLGSVKKTKKKTQKRQPGRILKKNIVKANGQDQKLINNI